MTRVPATTQRPARVLGRSAVVVRAAARPGPDDVTTVRARLAALRSETPALLELMCPPPTAAFGSRDRLLPGFAEACRRVGAQGFTPMVRPVGGHLAIYDEQSLVVHLSVATPHARRDIKPRFRAFAECFVEAFTTLGLDCRIGPVPGEYCEGEYSVNVAGRTKLVGTGQRITRTGFLLSAVVSVGDSPPVRQALIDGYEALDLDLRPQSVGSVADALPGVAVSHVQHELVAAFARRMELSGPRR